MTVTLMLTIAELKTIYNNTKEVIKTMKLITNNNCRTDRILKETPFEDIVCLTLRIKDRRVSPEICPLKDRPLTPEELRYAIKVANYAARILP